MEWRGSGALYGVVCWLAILTCDKQIYGPANRKAAGADSAQKMMLRQMVYFRTCFRSRPPFRSGVPECCAS
jgi:hypothetical protein